MLPPYMDRLNPERQQVFNLLKKFSPQFVLAGGTALMLQLGHRLSFDFDCFCEQDLPPNLLAKIKRAFGANISLQIKTGEMLSVKVLQNIEVSFVWHPYKPIRPPLKTGSINLFHLDDLVANKAYTIGRRNTWRDYVDLFWVLHQKIYSLGKIISLAEEKFKGEFNAKLFLGQLTYFEDIEIIPIKFVKAQFSPSQIQSFLEKEVEGYLKKLSL